jgi:predicted enzyme related to lactoylglutathione lyase
MMDEFPGRPIWIDLFTHDIDAAAAFYGHLLGWTVAEPRPEFGGYRLFEREGAPVAGLMGNPEDAPGTWSVYLESNNAADTVEMARANGGQVLVEAMAVGDLGTMAVLTDPGGALVGVWEPDEHDGFAARGEVGAPGWFEVLSNDYDAAVPFYENVFGWDTHTMSDTADFRYTTLGKDEHAVAGIMAATGPSHWSTYLRVDDTDATAARAVELGGETVEPGADTPYGRVATIADPTGGRIRLMGPNRG